MAELERILDALQRLVSYPNEHAVEIVELLYVLLKDDYPEAATRCARFGDFVTSAEAWQLEEAYTRTFDVNPKCALEVGWHLFGEDYERGQFLVRMREELRRYNIEESAELPDHLCHVLPLIAAMPCDQRERFVRSCVRPALEKMVASLERSDAPYGQLIQCVAALFEKIWTPVGASTDAEKYGPGERCDLLRDFPIGSRECRRDASVQLVELTMTSPRREGACASEQSVARRGEESS